MIFCDAVCYIAAALILLMLPLDWLLCACIAALVHECCHILALICLGGRVRRISVSVRGCVIDTDPMAELPSVISILAGPAGSLLMLLLCRTAPKIAVCGLFQGLYNLLPVLPLDGGRILHCILRRFCPIRADVIMECIAITVGAAILLGALYWYLARNTGIMPLFLALALNIRLLAGKIPCKPPRIKVQ